MNKHRKILSVLFVLLLLSSIIANGAEISVDRENSYICVKGTTTPNTRITLLAMQKDKSASNITDSESFNEIVDFIYQKLSLQDGSYSFVYKAKNPNEIMHYKLLINQNGNSSEIDDYEVFYFNNASSEVLADEVINLTDAKEVYDLIAGEASVILDLNCLFYSSMSEDDQLKKICKIIADITEGNLDTLGETFFEATLVETVNKNDSVSAFDAFMSLINTHELTEQICGLPSTSPWYKKLGGNTSDYKERMIKGIPYVSASDFYNRYRTSIALTCIEYLKNTFTEEIINDFNDVLNVDLSLLNNSVKVEVFTELAGENFPDAKAFQEGYLTAINNHPKTSKTGNTASKSVNYGGSYSGGGNNGSNSTTVTTTGENATQQITTPTTKIILRDVSEKHYAYDAIVSLIGKNILSGYPDGNFYPDAQITRAEFIKMLVNVTGATNTSDEKLKIDDVAPDAWYAPYVETGMKNGLIYGISEREFGPELPVTRQDAAVMLYRAVKYMNISLDKTSDIAFSDMDEISDYAKESVLDLSRAGILNGMDSRFAPKETTSRAQCAKMIYSIELAIGEKR